MQKKILLSLLVATPTALPALANIDLGSGNWTSTGVSTGEEVDIDSDKGDVTSLLGSGIVKQERNLKPGDYALSFSTVQNLEITISQNGKVLTTLQQANGTLTVPFTVETEGDVLIETKGITANLYSFTGARLELVVDFTELAATLQTELDKLTFVEITDPSFPGASDLLSEKETLENTKNEYRTIIEQLADEGTSNEILEELYEKYKLYEDPNVLATLISSLGENITDWNDRASQLNEKIANTDKNKAAKEALLNEQRELLTSIDKLIEDIKAGPVYGQTANDNLNKANTLKGVIETYAEQIGEAYADDKLGGEITFDSRKEELENKITEIRATWNSDVADYTAYQKYMNTIYPNLQNAYNEGLASLDGLKGINGYEDIYSVKIQNTKTEIGQIFTDAKNSLDIQEIKGAAGKIDGAEATVEEAVNKINGIVNDLKTLVETQNSNATVGFGQVNDFNERFDKLKSDNVPAQMQQEYQEHIKKISEAIEGLETFVKDNYTVFVLQVESGSEVGDTYMSKCAEIENLLNGFKTFMYPINGINNLKKDFEDARAYVKKASDSIDHQYIDIYALFDQPDGTFESIENAINNLTTVEELEDQEASITAAINDAKQAADNLKDMFEKLIAANDSYATSVQDLKSFVNGKIEIDENGDATDVLKTGFQNGTLADIEKDQSAFNKKLTELKDGKSPQDIFNNAKEMFEGVGDPYYWTAQIDEAKREFAAQITDSNNKNLKTLKSNIEKAVEESAYNAKETISFEAIETAMADIDTAIAAAAANQNNSEACEAYGDVDGSILDVVAQLKNIKAQVNAYDSLMGQLTDLQSQIDKLTEKNNAESYDNGKEYFEGVIDQIQGQWNTIKDAIDAALNNYTDAKKNVTSLQSDFQVDINNLSAWITKTFTDIENNNHYHNQQLAKAETVLQAIANAFSQLEAYYNNQSGIDKWYQETTDTLTKLRDNDLFNNNVAVANAYGKGESYAQNTTLDGEYERILKKIGEITASMLDDYTKAVLDANTATVEGAKWNADIQSMNDQYRISIEQYNNYYYGLTNQGWREYILPLIKRHEVIYQYSKKINDLIAEVTKYINDKNSEPSVITAEEFQQIATDKAEAMIAEMKKIVDDMNADATAAAETYYAKLHGEATTQINGYKDKLRNAGIESNVLDEVASQLKTAENMYAEATGEDATELLGLAMDRIANYLDQALVPVDLQPVAKQAWDNAYGDALEKVNSLLTALKENGEDYEFADEGLSEEAIGIIEDIKTRMADLNTEVNGVKNGLIDVYKDYKDQLDDLLNQAENAAQNVSDSSSNNLDNKNLYEKLTGIVIPDFDKDYQALLDYAATLVGGQKFNVSSIRNQIESFKQFVENNKGSLTSKSTTIDAFKNWISSAIENGYPQIGYNEQDYLKNILLPEVKVAFNDAKAAFMGAEGTVSKLEGEEGTRTINGWNSTIDDLANSVADIEIVTPFDKEAFRQEAQALEKALNDIYVEMEQSWTGDNHNANPVESVLSALEAQRQKIADEINAIRAYMAECEENLDTTSFSKELDDESDALDTQKNAWTNAGSRVLGMQPTYAAALDQIAADVAATKAALESANEQAIKDREAKEANQTAFDTLSGELEALKANLERVAAIANEWYPDIYDDQINWLRGLIDLDEQNLANDYKDIKLNGNSSLQYAQTVTNGINTLENNLYRRKANDGRIGAQTALIQMNKALKGHLVPETLAQLQSKGDELWKAFSDNYEKQTQADVTIEGLQEVINEYERISNEALDLIADAEEEAYVPGDVDLDPDGLVTAVDVQMLIRWVLDGTTWQDLYEANARQAYAADINGDKDLNITDVTMDISLMFGENPLAQRVAAFKNAAPEENNSISLALVSETNGVRRYALMLDNTSAMIAGQFDIKLPSGMRLVDLTVAERSDNHQIESADNADGLRVVLYSMENASFEGTSGPLFYMDVEGKGDLDTQNVIFTDSFFQTHKMSTPVNSSFIDSIVDSAKNVGSRIYNAAGMMFNKLQNGINIFRDKNGNVKKEYVRKK